MQGFLLAVMVKARRVVGSSKTNNLTGDVGLSPASRGERQGFLISEPKGFRLKRESSRLFGTRIASMSLERAFERKRNNEVGYGIPNF